MSVIQAVILGLVQGIAEFLPISSSGHLVLAQWLLGLPDLEQYIFFDVLLHAGTLVSVLLFFWRDVLKLIGEFVFTIKDIVANGRLNPENRPVRRLLFMLIIATVPLFVGVLINRYVEHAFSSPMVVGISLLFTGIILYLTQHVRERGKDERTSTYKNALVVGIFQLIAIFPGISRSGMTIFGGLLNGFSKQFAVKFSLLMSTIAIVGAAVVSVPSAIEEGAAAVPPAAIAAGMLAAFISGIFAIKVLVNALNKGKFKYFSLYCFVMGTLVIVLNIIPK